jgi:hypothetical protein
VAARGWDDSWRVSLGASVGERSPSEQAANRKSSVTSKQLNRRDIYAPLEGRFYHIWGKNG